MFLQAWASIRFVPLEETSPRFNSERGSFARHGELVVCLSYKRCDSKTRWFQHLDRDCCCQRFCSFQDAGQIVTHDTEVCMHRERQVGPFVIPSAKARRTAKILQLRRPVCHLQERSVPESVVRRAAPLSTIPVTIPVTSP